MKAVLFFAAILAYVGVALAHGDGEHATKRSREISTEEFAFGREGDSRKATRTVKIDMSDRMRFTPSRLTVVQGETVKFMARNRGKVMHEMVIGSLKDLEAHAETMKKYPGMEHDEPYMAHVAPGRTETMVWQFTRVGEFQFGCLVPGHFEAGMIGQIHVLAKGDRK